MVRISETKRQFEPMKKQLIRHVIRCSREAICLPRHILDLVLGAYTLEPAKRSRRLGSVTGLGDWAMHCRSDASFMYEMLLPWLTFKILGVCMRLRVHLQHGSLKGEK